MFTDEQLRVLGPRVKQEHVDALHWYVAKSFSYVRNSDYQVHDTHLSDFHA